MKILLVSLALLVGCSGQNKETSSVKEKSSAITWDAGVQIVNDSATNGGTELEYPIIEALSGEALSVPLRLGFKNVSNAQVYSATLFDENLSLPNATCFNKTYSGTVEETASYCNFIINVNSAQVGISQYQLRLLVKEGGKFLNKYFAFYVRTNAESVSGGDVSVSGLTSTEPMEKDFGVITNGQTSTMIIKDTDSSDGSILEMDYSNLKDFKITYNSCSAQSEKKCLIRVSAPYPNPIGKEYPSYTESFYANGNKIDLIAGYQASEVAPPTDEEQTEVENNTITFEEVNQIQYTTLVVENSTSEEWNNISVSEVPSDVTIIYDSCNGASLLPARKCIIRLSFDSGAYTGDGQIGSIFVSALPYSVQIVNIQKGDITPVAGDVAYSHMDSVDLSTLAAEESVFVTALNEASFSVQGTCSEDSLDVDLYVNTVKVGVADCALGLFSYSIDLSALPEGRSSIVASNFGGLPSLQYVVKDNSASIALASISDISEEANNIKTLSGVCDLVDFGSTISLDLGNDGSTEAASLCSNSGTFQFADVDFSAYPNGNISVKVSYSDSALNAAQDIKIFNKTIPDIRNIIYTMTSGDSANSWNNIQTTLQASMLTANAVVISDTCQDQNLLNTQSCQVSINYDGNLHPEGILPTVQVLNTIPVSSHGLAFSTTLVGLTDIKNVRVGFHNQSDTNNTWDNPVVSMGTDMITANGSITVNDCIGASLGVTEICYVYVDYDANLHPSGDLGASTYWLRNSSGSVVGVDISSTVSVAMLTCSETQVTLNGGVTTNAITYSGTYSGSDYSSCLIDSCNSGYVLANDSLSCSISQEELRTTNQVFNYTTSQAQCFFSSANKVLCSGENMSGQLGNGSSGINVISPVEITGYFGAKSLHLSKMFSCAIMADDSVKCAGKSFLIGLSTNTSHITSVPTTIPDLNGVKSLSVGDTSVCAIMIDGSVKCSGINTEYNLATGNGNSPLYWEPITAYQNAKQISLGKAHSCAIMADDSVHCVGRNAEGQLGRGTITAREYLLTESIEYSGAKFLSSGDRRTCAIMANDSVKCSGINGNSQTNPLNTSHVSTPITMVGFENSKYISVSYNRLCSISTDGKAFCMGYQGLISSVLGGYSFSTFGVFDSTAGVNVQQFTNVATELTSFSSSEIVNISHTLNVVCVLDISQKLKCSGSNIRGNFGNNSLFNRTIAPVESFLQ